jgi:hypothetical protein
MLLPDAPTFAPLEAHHRRNSLVDGHVTSLQRTEPLGRSDGVQHINTQRPVRAIDLFDAYAY